MTASPRRLPLLPSPPAAPSRASSRAWGAPRQADLFAGGTPAPGSTLTVLSSGGGQDSAALRELLLTDPAFRAEYAPGALLVVMSATGDEHDETADEVQRTADRCAAAGVPFVHITPDLGFHSPAWQSLQAQWARTHTVGSVGFRSTCSLQLKVEPFYRHLSAYVRDTYALARGRTIHAPLVEFAARYGRIRVLIGFAAGEESRANPLRKDGRPKTLPPYMHAAIEKRFPLIERGIDRAGAQAIVAAAGAVVPPPSLCRRCHWKGPRHLLLLKRTSPDIWAEWVEAERKKLAKFAHKPRNIGVLGTARTLEQHMVDIEAQFGHLTTEELRAWTFSHGHCARTMG